MKGDEAVAERKRRKHGRRRPELDSDYDGPW